MNPFIGLSSLLSALATIGGVCLVTKDTTHLINKAPFIKYKYISSKDSNRHPCLSMLPGLDIKRKDENLDFDSNNLSFFTKETNEPSRGCATVNWFKKELKNDTFIGEMQISWFLIKGGEGIMVEERINYSDEEDDIYSEHYIFWIREDGGLWNVHNRFTSAWLWNVNEDKKTLEIDKLFPKKPSFAFLDGHGSPIIKDYWGFVKDKESIKKMKGASNFTPENMKSAEGLCTLLTWEGSEGENSHSFKDFSDNLSERWDEAFAEGSNIATTISKANGGEESGTNMDFYKWKGKWSVIKNKLEDVTENIMGYYKEWERQTQ